MDVQMPRMRPGAASTSARQVRWSATVAVGVVAALVSFVPVGDPAGAKGWVPPKAPVVKPVKPVKPVVTASATSAVPAGAKFRCRDGTYSFVSKPALACWGHGGVAARV